MTWGNKRSDVKRRLWLGTTPKPISRWCYQLGTISLIGMTTILAIEIGRTSSSQAAILANWRFDPVNNQLEVTLQDGTTPNYFLLAQPTRIVLDLPNTQLDKVAKQQNYSGPVRQVRVSQFEKGVARIVLELSPEVVLAPGLVKLERAKPQRGKDERWLLRPLIAGQINSVAVNPVTPSTGTLPSAILPPATFGNQQPPVVSVPPLLTPDSVGLPSNTSSMLSNSQPTGNSAPEREPVISFGQPLPTTPEATAPPQSSLPSLQPGASVLPEETSTNSVTGATSSVVVPTLNSTSAAGTTNRSDELSSDDSTWTTSDQLSSQSPDILLSAGTQLSLRYAADTALSLKSGSPQKAELLLTEDMRDRTGKLLAPAGTPVIGRFETDGNGSRFIAQAITLQNRNIPLTAQSDILDGNRTTSKSATLQPGQILQIRVTEDLK